jgi:sarcosine oxidase/L-pipecolate oxidase
LLYENQFGFQKGKSTEHNLIKAVNYMGESTNNGKYCIGLLFDLKKAFDVVSHDILLTKLEKLEIQGVAL